MRFLEYIEAFASLISMYSLSCCLLGTAYIASASDEDIDNYNAACSKCHRETTMINSMILIFDGFYNSFAFFFGTKTNHVEVKMYTVPIHIITTSPRECQKPFFHSFYVSFAGWATVADKLGHHGEGTGGWG